MEKINCPLYPFYKVKTDDVCNENRQENIAILARYANANIPNEYKDLYMSNSPAKENQEDIYEILDSYIATFTKDIRIKNVYLYSQETGTGKTTTAIALLSEYIRRRFLYYAKRKVRIPETIGVFLDLNELQTKYNLASMSNSSDDMERIKNVIEFYQTVEMLVVDDVGVRSSTESFRSLIHSIINSRVSNGLPTIFTSNVEMESLTDIFDRRLYDRIRDQTLELTFKGQSKRGMR